MLVSGFILQLDDFKGIFLISIDHTSDEK